MSSAEQPEYDVEGWLKLIDRADYIDRTVTLKRGGSVAVRNFPTVCPDDAIDLFADLEAAHEANDPELDEMVEVAQAIFDNHFGNHIDKVE